MNEDTNILAKIPLATVLTSLLLIIILSSNNAYAINNIGHKQVCPGDYTPDHALKLCYASDLNSYAYSPKLPNGHCRLGYKSTLGLPFCVKKYVMIDIYNQYFKLDRLYSEQCLEDFTRIEGSEICNARYLALDVVDDELQLIIPDICIINPKACQSPYGGQIQYRMDCPIGFIRPHNVAVCLATDLVYQHNHHADPLIPSVSCPQDWYKVIPDRFCVPKYSLETCGKDFFCQKEPADTFLISTKAIKCNTGFAMKMVEIPVLDPIDPSTFTVKPVMACHPQHIKKILSNID